MATLGLSDWLGGQSSDQLFAVRVAGGSYSYRIRIEAARSQAQGVPAWTRSKAPARSGAMGHD